MLVTGADALALSADERSELARDSDEEALDNPKDELSLEISGVEMALKFPANDVVGPGLSGTEVKPDTEGEVVTSALLVVPTSEDEFVPSESELIGPDETGGPG